MTVSGASVVVTGGAGFLGRRVCAELEERGAASIVAPRSREYDLTALEDVQRMYADHEPDIVVHLAAEVGGIGANMANPGRYFYANLAMGLHLIDEARKRDLSKFVQIGTVCSYPKFTPVPFREHDIWNGYPEETNAPYGVAKKSLLVMLDAYRRQYGLNGIYLIPVNLYGPNDNFDPETSHVIPALIRKFDEAATNGSPTVTLWGTGSATREFLYVDDAARAIAMATESFTEPDPVNLGSGQEISIRDLASLIARLTGFTGEIVWDETKPDGQPRRMLDTSRAKEAFGFSAETDFARGIEETIRWWRETKG